MLRNENEFCILPVSFELCLYVPFKFNVLVMCLKQLLIISLLQCVNSLGSMFQALFQLAA